MRQPAHHKLLFLNPTWHYGENTTVRLGRKWYEKAAVGDVVEIVQTGFEERAIIFGRIQEVLYHSFLDLPLWVLASEHDPECRSVAGLALAMLRAYPEFTLDSEVTVIVFKIQE